MAITSVKEKLDSIREGGQKALAKGSMNLFTGYPSDLGKRVITALVIRETEEIRLLLAKLRAAAEVLDLSPLTAGTDYPLHATVLEGIKTDATGEEEILAPQRWSVVHGLRTDDLSIVAEADFHELIFDGGGNVILAVAGELPVGVPEVRTEIGRRYLEAGFTPRPLDHLFHITLQRLWDSERSWGDPLRRYARYVNYLSRQLVVRVPFAELYRGAVKPFLVR